MAREITQTAHPDIVHLRLYGPLTHDDMRCDEELGLNEGRPLYVLLDVTEMSLKLPERFLDGARNSFFVNRNLQHLAIVIKSPLLRSVALMVANVTGRRRKLTLFDNTGDAEAHLLKLHEARETQEDDIPAPEN